MKITTLVADARDRQDKTRQLIKDFSVFDFHHIPEEPLMREECRKLIEVMMHFEATGLMEHQAIIGSRGCGKTLTVKYLQRSLTPLCSLDIRYANCRHHNTSFKILAHLLGVAARGASLSELFDRFCATAKAKTVVILDEIDLMSFKDRQREILYFLSRSEKPFLVIMLANNQHVLQELDPATRSSLQPTPLHFKNYDAAQLQEILRERAQRGLTSWDEGVLAQIAAMTTRLVNSDARVAIKTLQYSVTTPGEPLASCFERARQDVVIDLINDLSAQTLMILWAVGTSQEDLARDIYTRYCRFSHDHKEKPFSYTYFYSSLSYLQSVGLVVLVFTKVNRTYTNRAILTFDRKVLSDICSLRFN